MKLERLAAQQRALGKGAGRKAALALAALVWNTGPALAQEAKDADRTPSDARLDTVVVTGARAPGVTARQSVSPVSVVTVEQLLQTGENNLIDALSRLAPSIAMPALPGELAQMVRSPRLRGLSPNQTLVLVNGKRRHTTANIATYGELTGAAAVDLDQIPLAAIDHIEVLQDGAAAQYGSDAIAGVINIILKSDNSEGTATAAIGRFHDSAVTPHNEQNGLSRDISINKGLRLGGDGFLNLSAQLRDKGHTNQTGADTRVLSGDPFTSKVQGDPQYKQGLFSANAAVKPAAGVELYAFGTAGRRDAEAWQNYRMPDRLPQVYPLGFEPKETISESDYSLTAGMRGIFLDDGTWDLSTTYGGNSIDIGVTHSANIDLFNDTGSTPTSFHAGRFKNSQWTTNLDVTKPLHLAVLPEKTNLAFGLEGRRETYQLSAGDAASRYKGGSSAYAGFSLTDQGDYSRELAAGYAELSTHFTSQWQGGIAARAEHYSDFGSTVNGKLSTRYDFSPALALRGTYSSGFRAPSLAEEHFSSTNIAPNYAYVQLPANSPAAKLVGASDLQPEKSRNLSIGLVAEPIRKLHVSIDAYRIDIDGRIVATSYLGGPAALAAIAANGNTLPPGGSFVTYFANGMDTRTQGIDVQGDYSFDLAGYGTLRIDAAANVNHTKIRRVAAAPAPIAGQVLYDQTVLDGMTQTTPRNKVVLTGTYTKADWTAVLRLTRYGETQGTLPDPRTGGAPFHTNRIGPKLITDVQLAYELARQWTLSGGVNNLFNVYPNQTAPDSRSNGANVYPAFSPFGINGAYYYLQAQYRF